MADEFVVEIRFKADDDTAVKIWERAFDAMREIGYNKMAPDKILNSMTVALRAEYPLKIGDINQRPG